MGRTQCLRHARIVQEGVTQATPARYEGPVIETRKILDEMTKFGLRIPTGDVRLEVYSEKKLLGYRCMECGDGETVDSLPVDVIAAAPESNQVFC